MSIIHNKILIMILSRPALFQIEGPKAGSMKAIKAKVVKDLLISPIPAAEPIVY
jgi:hypothetical protein